MFKCLDGVCPKGKLDACCFHCAEKNACADVCSILKADCEYMEEVNEEHAMIQFHETTKEVVQWISDLITQKKALEEKEKALKDRLKAAMEQYGIKSADTPLLKLSYIAPTVASSIDSAKLKKKYPEIAAECSKNTPRSAYVKVELKEGKRDEN